MNRMLLITAFVVLSEGAIALAQDAPDPVKLQAENRVLRASASQWADRAQAAEKILKERDAEITALKAEVEAMKKQVADADKAAAEAKATLPPSVLKAGDINPNVVYAEAYRNGQKAQKTNGDPVLDLEHGTSKVGRMVGQFKVVQVLDEQSFIATHDPTLEALAVTAIEEGLSESDSRPGAEEARRLAVDATFSSTRAYTVRIDGLSMKDIVDGRTIIIDTKGNEGKILYAAQGTWMYPTAGGSTRTIYRVKAIDAKAVKALLDQEKPKQP